MACPECGGEIIYEIKKAIESVKEKIINCDLICEEDSGLGNECGYSCEQVKKILDDALVLLDETEAKK